MKPDFILIGAMKCGTTTLAVQLGLQHGVFMTSPKEPNFYSDDDVYANGSGWYEALYSDARPDQTKGEGSTHYTKLPTHPNTIERMVAAGLKPKLIYMIRNPVERAISHYIHEWSRGNTEADITADFQKSSAFVDYGRYAMQIAPFIETFGPENILLTSLETLLDDPETEFEKICVFLDVPGTTAWQFDLEAQNTASGRVKKLPFQRFLIDNPIAETLRRTLVPKSLRKFIRDGRKIKTRPSLPATLRNELEEIYLKDRQKLKEFFPDNTACDACYPFASADLLNDA